MGKVIKIINSIVEVISIARETGARVVIAHVSQAKLLRLIHEAWASGVNIYAETCPHYLFITDEDMLGNLGLDVLLKGFLRR